MRKLLVLSLVSFLSIVNSASARECLKGEVDGAYVQSMESSGASFNDRMDRKTVAFSARIKINESGSYYVIGGFFKGKCWHKGWFTGIEFYNYKMITGDSGDVFDVYIDNINLPLQIQTQLLEYLNH